MRIAIIGGGISGLAAAWALGARHDVTLYEREARLGGHANTVEVDYAGVPVAVDTGFIVYNTVNYPRLTRAFEALGVATQPSDMSFGVSFARGWLEWAGDNVATLFAQKRNLLSLSHHAMWRDILRFNKWAIFDVQNGEADGLSLGDYLGKRAFSPAFRDRYLLPMGAAIWSASPADMLNFPARSLLGFFHNHGLLHGFNTFEWRTVSGGSQRYVEKMLQAVEGTIRSGCGVAHLRRHETGVELHDDRGCSALFDQVVLACHSDQALRLLGDATAAERGILGAIRYAPNSAVLHRDPSLMPRRRSVWSSWNYLSDDRPGAKATPVSLTYWMNRLQSIDRGRPLFVSLNPVRQPQDALTFARFDYAHPQFDMASEAARRRLVEIQGRNRIWFCGAYWGHGFHEDGLASGLDVAAQLGCPAPWEAAARPPVATAEATA